MIPAPFEPGRQLRIVSGRGSSGRMVCFQSFLHEIDKASHLLRPVLPFPDEQSLALEGGMVDEAAINIAAKKADQALRADRHAEPRRDKPDQRERVAGLQRDAQVNSLVRKHVIQPPAVFLPFLLVPENDLFRREHGRFDLPVL